MENPSFTKQFTRILKLSLFIGIFKWLGTNLSSDEHVPGVGPER